MQLVFFKCKHIPFNVNNLLKFFWLFFHIQPLTHCGLIFKLQSKYCILTLSWCCFFVCGNIIRDKLVCSRVKMIGLIGLVVQINFVLNYEYRFQRHALLSDSFFVYKKMSLSLVFNALSVSIERIIFINSNIRYYIEYGIKCKQNIAKKRISNKQTNHASRNFSFFSSALVVWGVFL